MLGMLSLYYLDFPFVEQTEDIHQNSWFLPLMHFCCKIKIKIFLLLLLLKRFSFKNVSANSAVNIFISFITT